MARDNKRDIVLPVIEFFTTFQYYLESARSENKAFSLFFTSKHFQYQSFIYQVIEVKCKRSRSHRVIRPERGTPWKPCRNLLERERERERKAEYWSVCPRIWYLNPVLRDREASDPYLKDFNPSCSLLRLAFTLTSWQVLQQIKHENFTLLTLAFPADFH